MTLVPRRLPTPLQVHAQSQPRMARPMPASRIPRLFLLLVVAFAASYLFFSARHSGHDQPAVAETRPGMVWIPGGEFLMGSDLDDARRDEQPVHRVRVSGFWIDTTEVTNAQFAKFVDATGYVTTAERPPDLAEIMRQFPPGTPRAAGGKNGARRDGLHAHRRAGAAGKLLGSGGAGRPAPTGGIRKGPAARSRGARTIPWFKFRGMMRSPMPSGPKNGCRPKPSGNSPLVAGSRQNTSSGAMKTFPKPSPRRTSGRETFPTRTWRPTASIAPPRSNRSRPTAMGCTTWPATSGNGAGDWYAVDTYARAPAAAWSTIRLDPKKSFDPRQPEMPQRVERGGSFLCNASYCASYRPSARMGNSPDTGMSHVGFRCVVPGPDSAAADKAGK